MLDVLDHTPPIVQPGDLLKGCMPPTVASSGTAVVQLQDGGKLIKGPDHLPSLDILLPLVVQSIIFLIPLILFGSPINSLLLLKGERRNMFSSQLMEYNSLMENMLGSKLLFDGHLILLHRGDGYVKGVHLHVDGRVGAGSKQDTQVQSKCCDHH